MIPLGSLRIHRIKDGDTRSDPGGMFGLVPRALWSRYYAPDESHLIHTLQQCLYVESGRHRIVIDTAMGTKMDEKRRAIWHLECPQGDLVAALGRIGVRPAEITLVINTHLHADHASGNTRFGDDGASIVATFPNAEYVVQAREYQDAMRPNERTQATYFPINYQPLMESGQMRLLHGDAELAPGVWGVVTPGHTPGHMSVRLESEGQHALFVCDMASLAVHMERIGWMTAYDVEPLVTLETKRRWQAWALETNAILFFPHDADRPAGRLTQTENGAPTLIPIDEPFA
jgi:glyoxylase-like metal-dependent hydrolase (beta-lactamase superfamily II)